MKDRVDAILDRSQAVYLESILPPRDALLVRMEEFAADENQPIADPEVAQMIRILVRTKRPRRIAARGGGPATQIQECLPRWFELKGRMRLSRLRK